MNIPGSFHPFVEPKPNSLIQRGTEVVIKDLRSEAGKLLNGKTGVAKEFFFDSAGVARWTVALEGEAKEKVKKSIKAENLVFGGNQAMNVCFITDPAQGGGGKGQYLVAAGKMWDGTLAIGLYDDPKRPGFDVERAVAECKLIGAPTGFMDMMLSAVAPSASASATDTGTGPAE